MTYLVYLDEFGHIGPYVSRSDPKHNDSPVFGLAGLILPAAEVRGFGTWFFKRKAELLGFELQRSGMHPAVWEKKGSSLYTVTNVRRYRELRIFTGRFFNKIKNIGGFIFYVGIKKTRSDRQPNPNRLYAKVLVEAIKRINGFCEDDIHRSNNFLLVLDEHDQRSVLITEATRSMYGGQEPRRHLIEPPFQAESHRYQTLQAADWIAGLVGRLGSLWADPGAFPENEIFHRYFGKRLKDVQIRSGLRN